MKNTTNTNVVIPTQAEVKAMKGLMFVEIQKLIKKGLSKIEVLETIKSRQLELSQQAFKLSANF
jgi:BarA-like signal transduction histidine kinase